MGSSCVTSFHNELQQTTHTTETVRCNPVSSSRHMQKIDEEAMESVSYGTILVFDPLDTASEVATGRRPPCDKNSLLRHPQQMSCSGSLLSNKDALDGKTTSEDRNLLTAAPTFVVPAPSAALECSGRSMSALELA